MIRFQLEQIGRARHVQICCLSSLLHTSSDVHAGVWKYEGGGRQVPFRATQSLLAKSSKQRHRSSGSSPHGTTNTLSASSSVVDWDTLLCAPNDNVLWATTTTTSSPLLGGEGDVMDGSAAISQRDGDGDCRTTTIALHKSLPNSSSSSLDFVVEAKDSVFQAYVAVDPTLVSKEAVMGLIEALKVDDPRLATEATHPFMYGALLIHQNPPHHHHSNHNNNHDGVALLSGERGGGGSSTAASSTSVLLGGGGNHTPNHHHHHTYVYDDDGEKGAGDAILSIIRTKYESILVANNVGCCVIISRWFGGTMLGPARFKIIAALTDKTLAAYTKNLQPQQRR